MKVTIELPEVFDLNYEDSDMDWIADLVESELNGQIRRVVRQTVYDSISDPLREKLTERLNLLVQKALDKVDQMNDDEVLDAAFNAGV